jgi:hypothetical protein
VAFFHDRFPTGEEFQLDPIFVLFAMTKPTGIRLTAVADDRSVSQIDELKVAVEFWAIAACNAGPLGFAWPTGTCAAK